MTIDVWQFIWSITTCLRTTSTATNVTSWRNLETVGRDTVTISTLAPEKTSTTFRRERFLQMFFWYAFSCVSCMYPCVRTCFNSMIVHAIALPLFLRRKVFYLSKRKKKIVIISMFLKRLTCYCIWFFVSSYFVPFHHYVLSRIKGFLLKKKMKNFPYFFHLRRKVSETPFIKLRSVWYLVSSCVLWALLETVDFYVLWGRVT